MLADAIGWALPELRAEAESVMSSTCSIAPKGTEPVTDDDTGEVTFPPGVAVYTGKCRVRPAGREATAMPIGGAEAFTFDYLVSIPFDAEGSADVREGMVCTISSSPDPALTGAVVEVEKVDRGDHITARRLACTEVA